MFRRPMARLATAVTAAGTICALGAGAALAAPTLSWSGPSKRVPGAFTNDTPALSSISFPTPAVPGVILAWRGTGTVGHIIYKIRSASFNSGSWAKAGTIPGASALAGSAPAFSAYTDPAGKHALLAAWTGPTSLSDHTRRIWYAQGETRSDGTISWTSPAFLPSTVQYTDTVNSPAVFFPGHRNVVLVSWRGPANHVRYVIGTPRLRGFTWSLSKVIPGNPPSPSAVHCTGAPCTSATPAITEASTGTATGKVYVFWKQLGTRNVYYATTPDPLTTSTGLVWSKPALVPNAATLTGPAASVVGLNGFGPLLLVYKAPATTNVRFQTLTGAVWSTPALVPTTHTFVTPALFKGLMATTTATPTGNIILHVFS